MFLCLLTPCGTYSIKSYVSYGVFYGETLVVVFIVIHVRTIWSTYQNIDDTCVTMNTTTSVSYSISYVRYIVRTIWSMYQNIDDT